MKYKTSNLRHCLVLLGVLLLAQSCGSDVPTASSAFTISLKRLPYFVTGKEVVELYDEKRQSFFSNHSDNVTTFRFSNYCADIINLTPDNLRLCEKYSKQVYDHIIHPSADQYLAIDLYSEVNFENAFKKGAYHRSNHCNFFPSGRPYNLAFVKPDVHYATLYIPLPQQRGIIGEVTIANPVETGLCLTISYVDDQETGNILTPTERTTFSSNKLRITAEQLQPVIDKYDCGLPIEVRQKLPSAKKRKYAQVCTRYLQ